MTKIKTIKITNFKAIKVQEVNFNGCTAIITAGNNKGKTSFLRGIPDRIRGEKPELIVKDGEESGSGEMELTTGEKFTWEFDKKGKDKLSFITKEGYKTQVTKEVVKKFFPPLFDIDSFLESAPKEQSKMLQKLIGIDFTLIDSEFKEAYDERTISNREEQTAKIKLEEFNLVPEKKEAVKLDELLLEKEVVRKKLNEQYLMNVKTNKKLREKYEEDEALIIQGINDFNKIQEDKLEYLKDADSALSTLKRVGYKGEEVVKWMKAFNNTIEEKKIYKLSDLPEYITPEVPADKELVDIDQKIVDASKINEAAQSWINYSAAKEDSELKTGAAKIADDKVKSIELRKSDMINNANFPTGITIKDDAIFVDGFALDKNQISTSKLYTAALRLASLGLGEVRSLHFDVSPLDKNTLADIQAWAVENDLQLLLERPDFEGGEITYTIIETAL